MICLMLDGAAQEACCLKFDPIPLQILGGDFDLCRAWDFRSDLRKAQASFGSKLQLLTKLHLRINQDEGHVFLGINFFSGKPHLAWATLSVAHVNHRQLQRSSDLLRRETDSICVVHCFEHIRCQRANIVIDLFDLFPLRTEHRVPVDHNFSNHF